ncbi:MAG: ABC transporter permease [Oscillospiraceae bacterium]
MARYAIKRVALAVLTILVVTTITFFLMNMVPGGPFISEKAMTAEAMAALNAKYGLDQPIPVQFAKYVQNIFKGDFGDSLKQRGRTVMSIITSKFPVSARLGGISVVVALVLGIPLGSVAALNRGKWLDNLIRVFATFGIAVPSFVLCNITMYFFGVRLGWFPTFGLTSPLHYILPVFSLAFYPTAYIARLMRSSMLDVLGQDYMRTAQAKGLSRFKMLFKHALRNAVLPVVTYIGPLVAYTLTGSFVVEKIFSVPGLGKEFVSAITNRDYTMIMGTTIFLAVLLIVINVLVDFAYKAIDPRIKLQ